MLSKKAICTAILFLLSTLWTLPASAQSFEVGVWFTPGPDNDRQIYIAFDGTNFVYLNTSSFFGCEGLGGLIVGYSKKAYDVTGNTVSGDADVFCKHGLTRQVHRVLNYDPVLDELIGPVVGLEYRRVVGGNPDEFVAGIRAWKNMRRHGFSIIEMLAQGAPELQVGADCTDPPYLVPFADLRRCVLSLDIDIHTGPLDMTGAVLPKSFISGIFNTNLTGANLVGAAIGNVFGSTLDGADLTDAFVFGYIRESSMIGAIVPFSAVEFVQWFSVICPDGTNSNDDIGGCINHL